VVLVTTVAIYLLGCTKGGVGKSTMTVNVASALALEGRRVCVVDADKQLHANSWCTNRMQWAPTLPRVFSQVLSGAIAKPLQELAKEYDDLVVDAGGVDSKEMRSSMRIANVILMPFAASQFDLYAVEMMDELLDGARVYNEALIALAFINKAETNWVRSRTAHAALEFIGSFSSMRRAETIVHLRTSPFTASIESGRSVFELGRGAQKAAEEVAALISEAQSLLNGGATDGVSSPTEDG
jgi:chromosome partitioning protein